MAGFFFSEDGEDDKVPATFATGPRTSFLDNFHAAYAGTMAAGRTDSREASLRSAYDPVVDHLNAGLRQATSAFAPSPDRDRFVFNPYRGREPDAALDAAGGMPAGEAQIWARIQQRRQTEPTFMAEIGKDREDFIARANAKARQALVDEADVSDRSTTAGAIGGFVGSMAGGFSDPVNLATLALGAGPAKSIGVAALREAGLNAGIEAATLPLVAQRRAEIGAPMTLGEAGKSILVAAAVGGVVGGGVEGLARGGRRLFGKSPEALSDTEMIAALDHLGATTPDVTAARELLADKVAVDASNPFADTPQGQAAHYQALDHATDRIVGDHIDDAAPLPKPSPGTEERLAAFSEPAGGGQRQQIEALQHDIDAALKARVMSSVLPPAAALQPAHAVASTVDRIIGVESRGRADAKNPLSSATGAGQFINSTWLALYKRNIGANGLSDADILARRTDTAVSRQLVDAYARDNAAALQRAGQEASPTNLYLAHFLGPGGATKLLAADPSTQASALVTRDAVRSNRSILEGKSAADVVAWARRKVGDTGPARRDAVPEVHETVAVGEEIVDGKPVPIVRRLSEVMDEHDADDAFISTIEACLR